MESKNKKGRPALPKENVKNMVVMVRVTAETVRLIDELKDAYKTSKSGAITIALKNEYKKLNKEKSNG